MDFAQTTTMTINNFLPKAEPWYNHPWFVGILCGLITGGIAGLIVWIWTTKYPKSMRQKQCRQIFKRQFELFKNQIAELIFKDKVTENLSKDRLKELLNQKSADDASNKLNDDPELFNEILFLSDSFFDFLRAFIQMAPDINPDTWVKLFYLRSESKWLQDGRFFKHDNQYFITFLFDILTGRNFSCHASDIYNAIDSLFVPLAKGLADTHNQVFNHQQHDHHQPAGENQQ